MSTEELSPTPWFWQLIDAGEQNPERMKAIMADMSQQDLERFHREFYDAVIEISGDAYSDVFGYGESKMQDLAAWVISQGQALYKTVYDNPEAIPRFDEINHSRSYLGLVQQVYARRFGKDIPM